MWKLVGGRSVQTLRGWYRGRRTWLALLPALAALVSAPSAAVAGASTVSGTLAFNGTAFINDFPCGLVDGCTGGSISGELTAALTGLDTNGAPWAASWPLVFSSMPTVHHVEQCPLPFNAPTPPTHGFGSAGLMANSGHFTLGGTGDPATLSGYVSWTFYGSTLIFNVDGVTVSGAGGTVAVGTGLAPGAGQFTPTGLNLFPSCATPGLLVATVAVADVQLQ